MRVIRAIAKAVKIGLWTLAALLIVAGIAVYARPQTLEELGMLLFRRVYSTGSISTLWGDMFLAAAPLPSYGGRPAYLAGTGFGLAVLERAENGPLVFLSRQPMWGFVHDIRIEGGRAYIAAGAQGLVSMDISNRTRPKLLGTLPIKGYPLALAVQGERGIVASKDGGGLVVFDVGEDGTPVWRSQYGTGEDAGDVEWVGPTVYAAFKQRLDVLRFSSDGVLNRLSSLDLPYSGFPPVDPTPADLALKDSLLYAAHGDEGLLVIDVFDPERPRVAGRYRSGDFAAFVSVSGDRAFVGSKTGPILMYSLPPAGLPEFAGRMDISGRPMTFTVPAAPDELLVAGWTHGLSTFRPRPGEAPQASADHTPPPFAYHASLRGSTLYVASGGAGLTVYDLTHPQSPERVMELATPGHAHMTLPEGNHLWLADTIGGMSKYSVADPARPTLEARWRSGHHVWAVSPSRNDLVVAEGRHGLTRLDPETGAPRGHAPFQGYAVEIRANDTHAFAGTIGEGVVIVDLASDRSVQFIRPRNPVEFLASALSIIPLHVPLAAPALALDGEKLYIGDSRGWIHVYDIRRPKRPEHRSTFRTGTPVFGLMIEGPRLWIAAGSKGLIEVDYADDREPRRIRTITLPGTTMHVIRAGDGRTLYAACGEAGLIPVEP